MFSKRRCNYISRVFSQPLPLKDVGGLNISKDSNFSSTRGAPPWFVHLEKFSLNFSSSLFVIRVNLLHP